ncbi:uncharacterized protein BYT42DRAFT_134316 [Radiomyces spectabilis]|uniref:uncharacterized protein n=1 Tax=Radiomyces spectabilis TaxID=64574 RepID=UPI00222026E4|nr:uncharacterized protein BYT42DRAFT_134316 [Radiomyces spectabilis]KAI8367659.1 hypothetical protein BYT42DRAFT_134316 [Radiomyces spectabilis]
MGRSKAASWKTAAIQDEDDVYGDEYEGYVDNEEEETYTSEDEEQGMDEDEFDEDEDEDDVEDEEEEDEEDQKTKMAKLKRTLAHVSFEQLAEIKSKMGMKEFSKARRGTEVEKKPIASISREQIAKDLHAAKKKASDGSKVKRTKEDMKRSSKHSPMEMSSKRAVGRFRQVVEAPAAKRRDPRFDKLSGHLNQELFEKSYEFLNDYRQSEIAMLKESIRKEKDPEEREKMQLVLTKMQSREYAEKEAKRKQNLVRERKKKEAELVEQGKKPYFLKRSEKRKMELIDKYKQYGEKNIERILEKRRKKNAAKDHRRIPFKRRSE